MTNELWSKVDDYLDELLVKPDEVFSRILERSEKAGLPPINVSSCQGKFLELMVRFQKAARVLEVGTLGGYSTVWLARGLPAGGRIVTLELDPGHAAVAGVNLDMAGVSDVVEIRIGDATRNLKSMVETGTEPFDFIFLDADKTEYSEYLHWSLRLSRSGTMIIADNVIRDGAILDANPADPRVAGVREFHRQVSQNPRLDATTLQTVGAKGYDGFSIIRVT